MEVLCLNHMNAGTNTLRCDEADRATKPLAVNILSGIMSYFIFIMLFVFMTML